MNAEEVWGKVCARIDEGGNNPENDYYCLGTLYSDRITECEQVLGEKGVSAVKFVIVVGIGGSNLGVQAVYDALRGKLALLSSEVPRLICLDTVSAPLLLSLSHVLEHEVERLEELLIVTVTKSGNTLETIANTEALMAMVESRLGNPRDRMIVISNEGSAFEQEAHGQGITTVSLEKGIGGRFSVFSVVSLVPLMALGFDVREFMRGAREELERGDRTQMITYLDFLLDQYHQKTRIHDFFTFNPELETLGKWHRQLMAESTGRMVEGEPTGLLPTVTIGSTDLHSQGQLYCSGSGGLGRMTTFVWAKQLPTQIRIPRDPAFHTVEHIAGKSYKHLMNALFEGITQEYTRLSVPYTSILLPDISLGALGGFMMAQILVICAFCEGIGVSPFGQDAVEGYKRFARGYLLDGDRVAGV